MRRLRHSPSMAKLALAAPAVELCTADSSDASGLVPHTSAGAAVLGGAAGTGDGDGDGDGCGGDGTGGGGDGVAAAAPLEAGGLLAASMLSSASRAAVTLRRPPVMTLSAPSDTLSTLSTISFLRSAYPSVTPRLHGGMGRGGEGGETGASTWGWDAGPCRRCRRCSRTLQPHQHPTRTPTAPNPSCRRTSWPGSAAARRRRRPWGRPWRCPTSACTSRPCTLNRPPPRAPAGAPSSCGGWQERPRRRGARSGPRRSHAGRQRAPAQVLPV